MMDDVIWWNCMIVVKHDGIFFLHFLFSLIIYFFYLLFIICFAKKQDLGD